MVWKRETRLGLFLIALGMLVFSPAQDAFAGVISLVTNQVPRIHALYPRAQSPSGFHMKFARNLDSAQLYRQMLSKQKQRQRILLHRQKIHEKNQEISSGKLLGEQKALQKKAVK